MRIKDGYFLLILVIGLIVGCGPSIQSVGTVEKVQGRVIGADGAPIGNMLVILQPTENGYVTEMEVDAKGVFEGELIPGKYVYYFIPSKKSKAAMPKTISAPFTEPKMEHLVEVKAGTEIICKAE
ncbi:hypothetical protein VN12_18210 [Pirellula sp. SH-Sr6A]|uniref:carboxypeptidase-like regulatory domain-containing protein n=1 Tax=Pirellula sp. SH-Sr6A TaxID=1632865 RepID=UPI00078DF463|nr:carboxypeptidase-like regulatory domain-containing protein [Pirellula sp. SH-Sr6A]AMV34070.1 hypothetical protein VN12_18210 [Pirellula sp. SH-Sr6A]